jgi:hypothetical protein
LDKTIEGEDMNQCEDEDTKSIDDDMVQDDCIDNDLPSMGIILSDATITLSSQILDYMMRPTSPVFEQMCLYDFVASTYKLRKGVENLPFNSTASCFVKAHPQALTHVLMKRRSPHVPVIVGKMVPYQTEQQEGRDEWC